MEEYLVICQYHSTLTMFYSSTHMWVPTVLHHMTIHCCVLLLLHALLVYHMFPYLTLTLHRLTLHRLTLHLGLHELLS